jgi:GNAT superfamily N-acetyltransferase
MSELAVFSPIVLSDGSPAAVRFLTPSDGALLIDLFLRLSPESRYLRFHTPVEHISREMLQHEVIPFLAVDGVNRLALVATVQEAGQEAVIGVARLNRGREACEAEIAVVVRDDRQRQGVGSGLLQRLAIAARSLGIDSFWALVLSSNRAALNIFSRMDVPIHARHDHGEATVHINLEDIAS